MRYPPSPISGLYAIVDPDFCNGRDPVRVATTLLQAGVKLLQVRIKTHAGRARDDVRRIAEAIRTLKQRFSFTLIINDDLLLARDIEADGLHVGQEDIPVFEARETWTGLLGLSTHTLDQVRMAARLPLDYIGFGAVFPTDTKGAAHPVPGLDLLREAVRLSPHPVVAIGGITPERVPLVLDAGASAYAAISALTAQSDIREAIEQFVRAANPLYSCSRGNS